MLIIKTNTAGTSGVVGLTAPAAMPPAQANQDPQSPLPEATQSVQAPEQAAINNRGIPSACRASTTGRRTIFQSLNLTEGRLPSNEPTD